MILTSEYALIQATAVTEIWEEMFTHLFQTQWRMEEKTDTCAFHKGIIAKTGGTDWLVFEIGSLILLSASIGVAAKGQRKYHYLFDYKISLKSFNFPNA